MEELKFKVNPSTPATPFASSTLQGGKTFVIAFPTGVTSLILVQVSADGETWKSTHSVSPTNKVSFNVAANNSAYLRVLVENMPQSAEYTDYSGGGGGGTGDAYTKAESDNKFATKVSLNALAEKVAYYDDAEVEVEDIDATFKQVFDEHEAERQATFEAKEAERDAANAAALNAAQKLSELEATSSSLTATVQNMVAMPYDDSSLPLLCGQPPILFGAGTPQEAVVPINWKQFDKETSEGYNWNGEPSAIGQQYINTSASSNGRYIAVPSADGGLTWKNF